MAAMEAIKSPAAGAEVEAELARAFEPAVELLDPVKLRPEVPLFPEAVVVPAVPAVVLPVELVPDWPPELLVVGAAGVPDDLTEKAPDEA